MAKFELEFFESDLELAGHAAGECAAMLEAAAEDKPFGLALSGGRIAQRFFSSLAIEIRNRRLNLDRVHFIWADERCVPPGHAESNFGIARQLLFDPLEVNPTHVHRIRGELEPTEAAKVAAGELMTVLGSGEDGQPVLDLILLGMGEDGHVASLFPGEPPELATDSAVYRAVVGPKPPPNRVTLGYGPIRRARNVWVLASGAGKETALRESMTMAGTTPLARVLASRDFTRIFTDLPSIHIPSSALE